MLNFRATNIRPLCGDYNKKGRSQYESVVLCTHLFHFENVRVNMRGQNP